MEKGELSNQPAPRIVFHYTYLFDEVGWPFKRLKWKHPGPKEFSQAILNESIRTVIMCPVAMKQRVRDMLVHLPGQEVMDYTSLEELKTLAELPWLRIEEYYDDNPQRGGLFGFNRWRTSTHNGYGAT